LARKRTGALVLLGDLNTTSWSPHFRDLINTAGLKDSRAGFGIQPTWPAGTPPLWIPLDHCLVSPEIKVHDRRVGPNVGSDHFPVIVEFSL
jgi:endonuclease/exonuclease/phosphatase (EEP) superfamily protein YafD